MNRPDERYDGTPKEAEFWVREMKDELRGRNDKGFPYEYAEWDGKLIYTGINGSVEFGPSEEAPIGEGTYYVYAKVRIPKAKTLTSDGTFILGKTFTILPSAYDLSYDPNVPDNASTKVSGAMPVQHFNSAVETRPLAPNQFILPGYTFDSWNTKPDGSGKRYENAAYGEGLSKGWDVTLYAQWKPKSYRITYHTGNAEGEDVTEKAFFDQPQKLRSIEEMGWTYENHGFLGWSKVGYSMILGDQEEVVNLGGPPEGYYNDPPDAELTAEWVANGAIVVAVTKDSEPQQVDQKEGKELFSLKKDSGETFTMSATYEDGRYVFDPSQATHGGTPGALPPGDYELTLDAKGYPEATTEISYSGEKPVSTVFDYYTVSLEPDPAYNDFHKVEMTGVTPDAKGRYETLVLDDSKVEIKTTRIADGYHFDGYSAAGACPEWEGGDNMKKDQTVKVTGHAEIMAHVEANKYTVHFDANTKAPVLGKMEDQDMVYDVPQELFGNVFQRSNAVFTGWNTKSDGSGKAYKDRERVKNLTVKDGDKVTLYAQWKEDPVKTALLTLDLTGGTLDGMTGKVSVREIVGNTITIPKAPKRERYYFLYWKGADNKVYEPGREYMVTGDQTFTAVWQPWEDWPEEPEDKVSGKLLTKAAAKGKNRLAISWSKVKGASGYDIFLIKCGKQSPKKVKTIKGNKTFKWTKSGLKKGTAYKFYVRAYVTKNGKKTYVRNSPLMHAYTGNGTKKYTNAKSVKLKNVKKGKLSLKKGKAFKIKAKVIKINKKKKLMPKGHAPALRYMTTNKKVVTVSKSGKITAKGKGTCTVYVFAHNGVSKQIKVTVK